MRFRIDNIRKIIRQPRNFTTTIFRNAVLDTTRMTRTSFTRESSPLSINSKTQLSTINRDNSANFRKQGILCVKYLRFFSPFFANVAFSKALIPFSKQTCIYIKRERERGEHSAWRPFCRNTASLLGSLATSQFPPKRNDLHAFLFVSRKSRRFLCENLRESSAEGEREIKTSDFEFILFENFCIAILYIEYSVEKVQIFLSRTKSRAKKIEFLQLEIKTPY